VGEKKPSAPPLLQASEEDLRKFPAAKAPSVTPQTNKTISNAGMSAASFAELSATPSRVEFPDMNDTK